MQIPKEEWKRFSKKFLISNLGRVFNLDTREFHRPSVHKSRANYYLRISIDKRNYMLHVIVAMLFHEPANSDCIQVDHTDGNTLNPAAYNLTWITPYENKRKMWQQRRVAYGEHIYTGTNKKIIIRKKVHKQ